MQPITSKLCRICMDIGEYQGVFTGLKDVQSINTIQHEITLLPEFLGKYVIGVFIDDNDYPHYKCPDDTFWCNCIDDKEFLHESVCVYESEEEAIQSLDAGVPKGSKRYGVFKIEVIEDDIHFVPLFRLNRVANNGVENKASCK